MDNRLRLDVEDLVSKRAKPRRKRDLNETIYTELNAKKVAVFTPEFLEQNRIVDSELRRLRKLNNDFDEHNSVLVKYIDTLTTSCDQTGQEIELLTGYKEVMKQLLGDLKRDAHELGVQNHST